MIYFKIFCKYNAFQQGGICLWEEAEAEAAAVMEAAEVISITVPAGEAQGAVQAVIGDIPAAGAMAEDITALIMEAASMVRLLADGVRRQCTGVPFPMYF